MKKKLVGINIQFPISKAILSGEKTVETRTYPLPNKYVGEELVIVETPGKSGAFKARMVATVIFGESFKYKSSKHFYDDIGRHHVTKDSKWAWHPSKPKWGWIIQKVAVLPQPKEVMGAKGIVFTKNLSIND